MNAKNTDLWIQFRRALLNGDSAACEECKAKILKKDGSARGKIQATQKWGAKCVCLLNEARRLKKSGRLFDSQEGKRLVDKSLSSRLGNEFLSMLYDILEVPESERKPEKKDLLREIQKFASWGNESELERVRAEFLRHYPEAAAEVDESVQDGLLFREYTAKAWKLGASGKGESALQLLFDELKRKKKYDEFLAGKMKSKFEEGKTSRKRGQEDEKLERQMRQNNVSRGENFQVTSGLAEYQGRELRYENVHANFVNNLPAAKKWTVLIDETGSRFDSSEVFSQNTKKKEKGRIIAVLVPDGVALEELRPGFHATGNSFDENRHAVDALLNAPCGILGIPIESLHPIHGELWLPGIDTLLDLIVRFIPIDEETALEVLVEQRELEPGDSKILQSACALCLNRLSRLNPQRAKSIALTGRIISKDAHPWLGYADVVAHCWSGTSSEGLLRYSGWKTPVFSIPILRGFVRRLTISVRETLLTKRTGATC
ncbi:MAG: hypothetical protein Q4D38_03605 [Planctomycetia bacterium]|nr:hypothetical protein [Planctomycetia bacterium]